MTDYLKRGNKLWEGSRMFLPQHKQALLNRKEEQRKVKKPNLDEQALAELDQTIHRAIVKNILVRLTYYRNGSFHQFVGHVDRYDGASKQLRIVDRDGQIHTLKISDIVEGVAYRQDGKNPS